MDYNLEKLAKGLKSIIVQLNVDCRKCDLCDSLNSHLGTRYLSIQFTSEPQILSHCFEEP